MRAVWLLAFGLLAGCARPDVAVPVEISEPAPTRAEIWAELRPMAERYRLPPAWVYAIVAAESDFNPRAQNGEARGLMQLTPAAWRTVATQPYEPAVWRWRENLATGIDYLVFLRGRLHRERHDSPRLLLAAFHHGYAHVAVRGFDPDRIAAPDGPIYAKLWAGDPAPVKPPALSP